MKLVPSNDRKILPPIDSSLVTRMTEIQNLREKVRLAEAAEIFNGGMNLERLDASKSHLPDQRGRAWLSQPAEDLLYGQTGCSNPKSFGRHSGVGRARPAQRR